MATNRVAKWYRVSATGSQIECIDVVRETPRYLYRSVIMCGRVTEDAVRKEGRMRWFPSELAAIADAITQEREAMTRDLEKARAEEKRRRARLADLESALRKLTGTREQA